MCETSTELYRIEPLRCNFHDFIIVLVYLGNLTKSRQDERAWSIIMDGEQQDFLLVRNELRQSKATF